MLAAIDYYTARIAELTARIEDLREPYASQGSTFGPATMDQDSSHSIQTGTVPVFLALDCPARGHHVQGGPAGRRTRSATPTLDPAATHLVVPPMRKTGKTHRRHGRPSSPASATRFTAPRRAGPRSPAGSWPG